MKQALEKRLGVVLCSTWVLVFLIGVFQCSTITKLADADRQVARSHQALGELTVMGLLLDQAEAATSVYPVTASETHLESFRSGQSGPSGQSAALRISESLHRLRGLWADHPSQRTKLDALDPLLAAELARPREARLASGNTASSPARPSFAATPGPARLEAARRILGTMEDEERQRLKKRTMGARVVAREAILSATLGSGLALWLLALTGLVLRHYVAERRRRNLSHTLSSQLLGSMEEGVWLSDESGPILYANPACEAMFGYEQGELPGKGLDLLVEGRTPGEAGTLMGEIQRHLERRVTWKGELTARRKDGSRFSCYTRITALELSGERHWLAVQENISDRKPGEPGLAALDSSTSGSAAVMCGKASPFRRVDKN